MAFAVALVCVAAGGGILMAGSSGAARAQGVSAPRVPAPGVAATLASRRVFFGHQSVGKNLLDGLAGVPGVRMVEVGEGAPLAAPALGHALVGRNTEPRTKLADFERLVAAGPAAGADVALMKFCYVDVDASTDVQALFADYQATYARLAAANPRVRLAHVTVPLTVVQRGPKASLKRLLGRPVWGERENAQRHAFNELLRAEYGGKAPLFDLAALEAQHPDGSPERYTLAGRQLPALVPAYSDDGEHLNADGRARLGAAFAEFLASVELAGR